MERLLDSSISELMVLKDYTTDKFYIGKVRLDPDGLIEPHIKYSGLFETITEAEEVLAKLNRTVVFGEKSLYRSFLEKSGFVSTRAADLDQAVRKLHSAMCRLDLGQLEVAEKLLNTPIKDVINEFAKIEELRGGF